MVVNAWRWRPRLLDLMVNECGKGILGVVIARDFGWALCYGCEKVRVVVRTSGVERLGLCYGGFRVNGS